MDAELVKDGLVDKCGVINTIGKICKICKICKIAMSTKGSCIYVWLQQYCSVSKRSS